MSKQKKKKTNTHHLEKVAKAQQKNEYIRKMRKVLNAIGCSHIEALFPPGEFELLYQIRCQSINIVIAPGDVMPPGKLKWIKRILSAMLKRYEIQLLVDGGMVDLDTYFTAGITLLMYGNSINFEHYPKADQVKEALMPYLLDKKYKNQAYIHLKQIAETTSLMMNDPIRRIYWATVKLHYTQEDNNFSYKMVWHSAVPQKIHVPIQGETHTAYRLGSARYQTGPAWITYKAGHDMPDADNQRDVVVYIQSHVLQRLYERIDCIPKETVFLEFIKSMEDVCARRDGYSGKIFVDLRLYNVKVGYLLASMVDNKLILRTFLFITLLGSPEGELLRKNAKLKKEEITFLELDRLSTFMTPEIQHNKHIKQFFIDAGLKPLFDLYKILQDKNIALTKHANTTLIEDYLGIDLTREFMDEDDEIVDNDDITDDDDEETGQTDYIIEDDDDEIIDKDELFGEEYEETSDDQPATEAQPEQTADADAAKKPVPKLILIKRIYLAVILFVMRSLALLLPFINKASDQKGKSKDADDDSNINLSKYDKFSSSHFTPIGKIFGWIFMLIIGLPFYILFVVISIILSIFRKEKKKRPTKIDYKQFNLGLRHKKKRK